mgnify:CR=1 FL=1|tara:strand:- start:2810 stop:3298 length:489 start_codon:yes stop_codon:yes gene_type:complete
MKHKLTKFENKWGIPAYELALLEDVETASIHMRVMRFGHPFQRRGHPSKTEIMFGETIRELAIRYGCHPNTCGMYIIKYGIPYCPQPRYQGAWNKGANHKGIPWQDDPMYTRIKPWLMEEHPDFYLFRNSSIQDRLDYLNNRGIEVVQPSYHTMAYEPGEIE